MKWLNIYLPDLHSAPYIGSEPRERAAWLSVLGYCAEQENGGRIADCRGWKDRQWQQTCGVTLKEVQSASKLLVWDDQDLTVVFYPIESEKVVQAKRLGGSRGGQASGQARSKDTSMTASSTPLSTPSSCARTEGKGNEREEEGNKDSAPPPGDTPELPLEESFPVNLGTEAFRQAWDDWLAYRRERRLTSLKPRSVAAQLKELSEWGEAAAITSIRDSIRQQWQGLFPPKAGIGQQAHKSGGTSTYELEKKAHGYTI
jgi:hypothetical protein